MPVEVPPGVLSLNGTGGDAEAPADRRATMAVTEREYLSCAKTRPQAPCASREAVQAYSAKGLSTWIPVSSKSLTLRVTTVMPCTRAVAAMSASITGRGCSYC